MNTSDPAFSSQQNINIFHHSFRKGGGMERYALTIAENFHKLGRHVIFHAYRTDRDLAKMMDVELAAVRITSFPRKLRDFRYFRHLDKIRPQIIGPQIALCRVRSRDLVICGGTHRGYLERARKFCGCFDLLQIWMEKAGYAYARKILSHSELCTEELQRLYQIPREKIITLFPPVDFGTIPPIEAGERLELRQKFGLPPNKVIFLFPSMGHSRKGLKPICEALAGLSDNLVLAVAGKSPAGKQWPFVQFLGYLDNMMDAYRAADFTILGSNYEPFGLVGPESILCGTPLVFEENIGCLAAIKPEAAITFSVRNRDSIRAAVLKALSLARTGLHHLVQPLESLRYNPSAMDHAAELLRLADNN